MKNKRSFVVLGGAGAIGRIAVRDLFESHRQNRILIADYNLDAARAWARTFRSRRVTAARADASRPRELAKLFRGRSVVINCTQHDFNLRVMSAALAASVHYVDLGGLFVWTRKQLKLDAQFRRAGLTAIIGMGCAPGITNVMAGYAAQRLKQARSLAICCGSRDFNPQPDDFSFPYSAQTIVEEFTLAPWVFRRGRFRQVKPRTGWELVKFPWPVGPQWVVCTRHSEVATLPGSLHLENCDFKVSFDKAFVREVMKRLRAGWTVRDFARLPTSRARPDDCEIARVVVRGDGKQVVMDCHARAKPEWHASAGDIDTGCPPSIVAQMVATGQIVQRGVWPPEVVVPAEQFFRELRRRGMKLIINSR